MEHVYSVIIPNLIKNSDENTDLFEWILEKKCLCSVSNLNLLAFLANTDLKKDNLEFSCNNLYIVDLNLPNEPYLVENHNCRITALEWDPTGKKLVVGDEEGKVEIWTRKDYLVNQWVSCYKQACFEGDTVLIISWYNNSIKHRINLNKIDFQGSYYEKYDLLKVNPTVKQFGNKSAEGFLCISNSGYIWSICFSSDGSIATNIITLGETQNKVQIADINYRNDGSLLIATSNGLVNHSINFYNVFIELTKTDLCEKTQLMIQSENFTGFFPKNSNDLNNENKNYQFITHLKFITKEESNGILVGCAGNSGSCLYLWELHERNYQVHKRFLNNENQNTNFHVQKIWICNSSCNYTHHIVSLSILNSSIYDYQASDTQPFIVVAYKDNIIKCLIRDKLQPACLLNLNTAYGSNFSSKTLSFLHVDDMQFTWSGSGLIIIDNAGQIFLYKVPSLIDYHSELCNPMFIVMLLEYSMICSYDWWDVLLNIKPNLIETVCDKLTENFNKNQHQAIQQKYQQKFLVIKGSIYRISNIVSIGLNKSGDCYALTMLFSIANLLRSFLRTTKNPEKEGPVENITHIVQNNTTEFQLTKIMLILENKDYCVESPILQSLKHLNQWVGDLALYLVGSYPQQLQSNIKFPGGGLIHDISAINTIRELLVIIQIWGLLNESCLPVFTKLNDNDIIANLYKLLTKSISFINSEPDEHLLEEYCNLPNNVLIPQLDLTLKAKGVISPPLYFNDWPLVLHYFKEAPFLSYQAKIQNVDGAINCNLNCKIDVTRRIGLGNIYNKKNSNMRVCTRCESISLLQTTIKTPATLVWDKTWQKQCICGGHWKLYI